MTQDYANQTAQMLTCIGHFMKEQDANKAKECLGMAVVACQRDESVGDEIPRRVFELVFPGEEIPPTDSRT